MMAKYFREYSFNGDLVTVLELAEILGCKETTARKYATQSHSGEYTEIVTYWKTVRPSQKAGRKPGVKNNVYGVNEWKSLGQKTRKGNFKPLTRWDRMMYPDSPRWPKYDPNVSGV